MLHLLIKFWDLWALFIDSTTTIQNCCLYLFITKFHPNHSESVSMISYRIRMALHLRSSDGLCSRRFSKMVAVRGLMFEKAPIGVLLLLLLLLAMQPATAGVEPPDEEMASGDRVEMSEDADDRLTTSIDSDDEEA